MRSACSTLALCFALGAASPAIGQTAFKVVDAADLEVGHQKYADRDIEVRDLRCYFANVGDYRCAVSGVTIFGKGIATEEAKRWVEENCDEIKKVATSNKCKFTVRFRYSSDDVGSDITSGYQRRTTVNPDMIDVVLPKKRGR